MLKQLAFSGDPSTQLAVHTTPNTGATLPHIEVLGQLRISPMDVCFPRPLTLMSWLAHQLLVCKPAPMHRRQGETEKEADHSRLLGSRFNKQENLLIRLVLGGYKMSKLLHPSPKSFFFLINTP